MVLQKRLDYGSSGYQVPAMPHVPRSAKGKRSVRKKVEDNQMCPFELLATVAGKLLSERENSVLFPQGINGTSNTTTTAKAAIEKEQLCKKEPLKSEALDQQSCSDNILGPEIVAAGQITCGSNEHSQASRPTDSGPAPLLIKSDTSDAIPRESMILNNRVKIGCPVNSVAGRCGTGFNSPTLAKVQEDVTARPPESEHQMPGNGLEHNALHLYSLDVPKDLDAKPPALISSDSSAEVPVCRNYVRCISSLPKHESGMELVVDRDDDDNSSGCTHPSNITNKAASRPQCIGDHGVRKLSAPKYWKATPNMLKYGEISNYGKKPGFCGKKICYTRQRTQRSYFKRRKLFERRPLSTSNVGFFSADISNLCEKVGINVEARDPHATVHATVLGANGASSSKIGQNSSYDSVKLSIKSFKVPELFIEIPETATVGSLKTTVMEAVTAILQGGLRVGVLLQGKKVRDDNKTLLQAGISHSDKLDNLGFTLEPTRSQTPPSLAGSGDTHFLCLGDVVEPLARIPPIARSTNQENSDATPQPVLTSCPESDHASVHSPTGASSSLDKIRATSRALVALPPMSVEALAVVPLRKPRRPEHVQRRIRRPFSVTEVEALVQAVEKLGTGRWRDVKLRAFDNAKHRTYVDLKDKWKTLVHTARISPQQRRGEPVPQELLDRVLSAQAYWSQQQAKLHAKPPAAETCLLV